MNYNAVSGTKPTRFWTVTSDSPDWDLNLGDLLVFEDSMSPTKIARVRPTTGATPRVLTVDDWGKGCSFSSTGTNTGQVMGQHIKEGTTTVKHFIIDITATVGTTRGTHTGRPTGVPASTWMADEGP